MCSLLLLYFSDEHINSITQQTMVSSLDGDRSRDLHLSLRLSVCEGVKVMYQKYQNKKWSQVNFSTSNFPNFDTMLLRFSILLLQLGLFICFLQDYVFFGYCGHNYIFWDIMLK